MTSEGFVFDYKGVQPGKSKPVGYAVAMSFVNSLPYSVVPNGATKSTNDYIFKKRSVHGAKGFSTIYANEVFRGIDMRSTATPDGARWDMIVKPNADPNQIKVRFDGVAKVAVNPRGDLVYSTAVGERKLTGLLAYQTIGGKKRTVKAGFQVLANNTVGFSLGQYDHTKTLVIDPLVYGSYFGSDVGDDEVHAVVADTEGSVYMTGATASTTFPAANGTHGLLGAKDAFITLFQGDAYGIDYNAYVGGSGSDSGDYIALTPNRDAIWIVGTTDSTDLPGVDADPTKVFQQTPGANFAMRIPILTSQSLGDPTTTYFGGDGGTYVMESFKLSPILGNLVFAGICIDSVPGPATHPAPGQVYVYVLVLDPSGVTPRYSTYLGGSDPNSNIGLGVSAENFGNGFYSMPRTGPGLAVNDYKFLDATNIEYAETQIALTGFAGVSGQTFIDTTLTPSAFPSQAATGKKLYANGTLMRGDGGSVADAFVAKYSFSEKTDVGARTVDPAGIKEVYAALLGGTQEDFGVDIAIDDSKNVYVVAESSSFDYPRTRGVLGENSLININVTKIDPEATSLVYSTGLNADGEVWPVGIAVDRRGVVSVTGGVSGIPTWPQKVGNPDAPSGVAGSGSVMTGGDGVLKGSATYNGTDTITTTDAWVNVINATATELLYGSYIGGTNNDFIYGPYVDASGDIWLSGWSDSYMAYTVPATGANPPDPKQVAVFSALPSSHITSLAWKNHPDLPNTSTGTNGAEGIETWFYRVPSSITVFHRRDGYIGRFRVGLPSLKSLALGRSTAPGGLGMSFPVSVALDRAALASGADVILTLDATTAASFSQGSDQKTFTVHIDPGQTTPTAINQAVIYTKAVTSSVPVQIKGVYEGTFKIAQFSVVPWLQQISISPDTIIGGNPTAARVTLLENAVSDITVTVTGSDDSIVVGAITVPKGSSTAVGSVGTNGVDANKSVQLTGSLLGYSQTVPLTIIPARVTSLTLDPTECGDLIGVDDPSRRVTATIGLDGKTGPSGAQVVLSTNKPGLGLTFADTDLKDITGPFTLKANAGTGTFYVKIPAVPALTSVVINAKRVSDATQTASGTLRIRPIQINSVVLNAPLSGGVYSTYDQYTLKGTITLSGNAPLQGTSIYLTLKSGSGVHIPAKVDFASGERIKTFAVTTDATLVKKLSVIRASRVPEFTDAFSADVQLEVKPITITSFTFNPTRVAGGFPTKATVTLVTAAPTGGLKVNLIWPTGTPIDSAPASVTIPAGKTSVTVTLTTKATLKDILVTATATRKNSPSDAGDTGVEITSGPLSVIAHKIVTMTLDPASVYGGTKVTGTLVLGNRAPVGGITIYLSSKYPTIVNPTTKTIVIPYMSNTATFSLDTFGVLSDKTLRIYASRTDPADLTLPGITRSAVIKVLAHKIVSLSLNPSTVYGGFQSTGTVTLNAPATGNGTTIYLTSSSKAVASPDAASVVIPVGATSATFTVTTIRPTSDRAVTITASRTSPANRALPGLTADVTLKVVAQKIASLTLAPSSVYGGSDVTGTVTLTGPAPAGGITVYLSSKFPTVAVPSSATVTVPAGATSANFTVTTFTLLRDSSLKITASLTNPADTGSTGLTQTAVLNVLAHRVLSLSFNPSTVYRGKTSTGTVTLSSPAPAGGMTIYLFSGDSTVVQVPTTVVVPAGSLTGTFTAETSARLFLQQTVKVTASRTNPADQSGYGLTASGNIIVLAP